MDLKTAMEAHRKRVDHALATCFDEVQPGILKDATRWYPDAGGKRLRPVMAMLACEAAGGSAEDALPVALAVELVHNFSLVHDDIMDRDDTRRGRPTVHRKWDEPTAILAGDVLFARAFEVLSGIEDAAAHRQASRILSEAIRHLCEGQARDMLFERAHRVTPEEYLHMIRGKTALLFEASCRGGVLASPGHDPNHADALSRYGETFGMAFQVADDLLDVTADTKTMGKPWGSDIRAGKRTIMVLDALARASGADLDALHAALGRPEAGDQEVARAVEALRSCGAIARAERLRDDYAKQADEALAALPDTPARAHLRELNEWARTRGM